MTAAVRMAPTVGVTILQDGTLLVIGPSTDIPQWQRDALARRQSTTASSSRELRRRAARELRRQAKRDRQR